MVRNKFPFNPFSKLSGIDDLSCSTDNKTEGADINARDYKAKTPMNIAKSGSSTNAIKWLEVQGANTSSFLVIGTIATA